MAEPVVKTLRRTNGEGEAYLVMRKRTDSARRSHARRDNFSLRVVESAPVRRVPRRDIRAIVLRPEAEETIDRVAECEEPLIDERNDGQQACEAQTNEGEQVNVLAVAVPVVPEEQVVQEGETDGRPVKQIEWRSITEKLVQYLERTEDPRIAWMENRKRRVEEAYREGEPEVAKTVAVLLPDADDLPVPEGDLDGLLVDALSNLMESGIAPELDADGLPVPEGDLNGLLFDALSSLVDPEATQEPESSSPEEPNSLLTETLENLVSPSKRSVSSATSDGDDEVGTMSDTLADVLLGLLPNGRSWDAPRIRRKKKRRGKRASRPAHKKSRIRRVRPRHIKVKTRPLALGKQRKKRKLTDFLPLLGLLVAVAIFAWPVVSDAYKQWAYSQTISEGYAYDWEDPRYQEILEQANLYNKMLAGRLPADVDVNSIWPYEKQLDYGSGGMIAWVEIPDLTLKLPIYHGSNDESLMAGVGHMERTSLPVGGDHTKCAISGHTGMQNERMFDSLDDLEKDDIVIIHALGKDLYYSVTYKEVVEPTALDKLYIDCEDAQLVLITCTPRGVNSHRLLVHAVQVDEASTQVADTSPMDAVMNYLLSPTVIFFTVMMLVLLLLFLLWLLRWRKKKVAIKVEELDGYNALTTKLLEEGLESLVEEGSPSADTDADFSD